MRMSYVFFCTEQPQGKFPGQRFLQATSNSLKLFPFHRRHFGILQLSFTGMIFGFITVLFLLTFLVPRTLNIYWILSPMLILWGIIAWRWAVQIAFRYSERQSYVGLDLRVLEVKFGFANHRLLAETAGGKTVLIVNCRRRTLNDALELAFPSGVPGSR